jgi:hypothetical protein
MYNSKADFSRKKRSLEVSNLMSLIYDRNIQKNKLCLYVQLQSWFP